MSAHFLSTEVAGILQTLSVLPGGKTLGVQTKRYPRLLPAESGTGYEERSWRFAAHEAARDIPLPSDADDIIITWKGVVRSSIDQRPMRETLADALKRIADSGNWDHDIWTRPTAAETHTAEAELEVRVYQRH